MKCVFHCSSSRCHENTYSLYFIEITGSNKSSIRKCGLIQTKCLFNFYYVILKEIISVIRKLYEIPRHTLIYFFFYQHHIYFEVQFFLFFTRIQKVRFICRCISMPLVFFCIGYQFKILFLCCDSYLFFSRPDNRECEFSFTLLEFYGVI